MSDERLLEDLDWDSLWPGVEVEIGNIKVPISPMGLKSISIVLKRLKEQGINLKDQGVLLQNYKDKENLITLAMLIIDKCPEVISIASNIDIKIIDRLPVDVIVNIIDAVIKTNLESKESLEKNLLSLEKTVQGIMTIPETKDKE